MTEKELNNASFAGVKTQSRDKTGTAFKAFVDKCVNETLVVKGIFVYTMAANDKTGLISLEFNIKDSLVKKVAKVFADNASPIVHTIAQALDIGVNDMPKLFNHKTILVDRLSGHCKITDSSPARRDLIVEFDL